MNRPVRFIASTLSVRIFALPAVLSLLGSPSLLQANGEKQTRPKIILILADVPALNKKGRPTGGKVPGTLKSNMQYLDHLLGRLREGLAKQGRTKDTVIFFSADNGTADIRKPNRVMDKNSYDRDNGIRVPLVVGGGPVKPRGSSEVLVDFTDFWPTFAQLAGYQGSKDTDGHSFAPYLLGEPFTPREIIQMAMNNADRKWFMRGWR